MSGLHLKRYADKTVMPESAERIISDEIDMRTKVKPRPGVTQTDVAKAAGECRDTVNHVINFTTYSRKDRNDCLRATQLYAQKIVSCALRVGYPFTEQNIQRLRERFGIVIRYI